MKLIGAERALLDRVDARREALVETVRELVRIDTVNPYSGESPRGGDSLGDPSSGSPGAIPRGQAGEVAGQDAVEAHLRALGATTRRFEPPPDTYERAHVIGPRGRSWKGRPNLVGEWRFGGDGPHVIVVGHIDTVGVQGMANPFGAELRDGRIWGRGTSDDKGGLAVGLAAIEALLTRRNELRGRLTYLSVVDEECNGSGAGIIACTLEGIHGDAAISVDGEGLEITRGCGGVVTADIIVHGMGGHGSFGNGVNAVEKAIRLAEAALRFGDERRARLPHCLLNLGIFHGGTLHAVIPDRVRLGMNVVYDMSEAMEAKDRTGVRGGQLVWDALERAVREAEAGDQWLRAHPSDLVWVKDLVPYEVSPDTPVVRDMRDAARDVMGVEPTVAKMTAWTDSCWLQVLADTPIVVFGPGEADVVHGPKEHVKVDQLVVAAKAIALYLYRALKVD